MNGVPVDFGKKLRSLDDIPMDGRRVLVRVDFNVSMNSPRHVDATEDYRLEMAIPTIQELQRRRCKVLLLTHLGDPKKNPEDLDVSPICYRLQDLLGEEVKQVDKLYGQAVDAVVSGMSQGEIVLLPNVRSDEREELGNERFAQFLADNADAYVNEAFSACHRPHASIAFLPNLLPSCAGRRTVTEVEELDKLRWKPAKPYIAIASGAKIETKIGMLYSMLSHVDKLCVGGQLANVFLAAQGKLPGSFDSNEISAAQIILEKHSDKLVLPVDIVIGNEDGTERSVVNVDGAIDENAKVYDIGPVTTEKILELARSAATVLWNGPVGMFEVPAYAEATRRLAREIAQMTGYRVVGGGDTVNALEQEHVISKYNHVSIGGGAMIAYLEGKRMPGLSPLFK